MSADFSATRYEWRAANEDDLVAVLIPVDESNVHSMTRIASIRTSSVRGFDSGYSWPPMAMRGSGEILHCQGHKTAGGVYTKTAAGGKRYIERELSKFWLRPTIVAAAAAR